MDTAEEGTEGLWSRWRHKIDKNSSAETVRTVYEKGRCRKACENIFFPMVLI